MTRIFKTVVSLLVVLALAFAFGCNPGEQPKTDPTPGIDATEEPNATQEPDKSSESDTQNPTPEAGATPSTTEGADPTPTQGEKTPGPTDKATPKPTAAPTAKPTPENKPDIADFKTKDLNGTTYSNSLFGKSKLTMLNVWATWCNPCIGELPALQQLSDKYKGRMQVVGILFDSSDAGAIDSALTIVEGLGVKYPSLRCNSQVKNAIIKPYGINKLPSTLFVDSNGNVVKVVQGEKSFSQWSSIVDGLL